MSVQDQLQRLYLIDQQIRGLRSRVDSGSRRLTAQQTRLEQFQRQASEIDSQLRHAKASAGGLENDSNTVEQRIEKIRQTMAGVRSNKEYQALLVEVNVLKTEKGSIEEKALEHLNRVDEFQTQADEMAAKVAEQQKIVDGAQAEVTSGEAEIAQQLGDLKAQRAAAAEPIDTSVLALYEKLSADLDGEALAEIEEQDRRRMEYTCGACYMSLPIQVVNATLTSKERPVLCSSCGRILHAANELKNALVPKS